MKLRIIPPSLCVAVTIVYLALVSCSGSKRAVLQNEINAAKAVSKKETAIITNNQKLTSQRVNEEKIDSAINSNISLKLKSYKTSLDSFDLSVLFIDSVIKTHKLYKKNKAGLIQQLTFVRNYSSNTHNRLRRFEMIDDGLAIAQQYLFNLAAFFGPGKYEIPSEKLEEAQIIFSPILDSVVSFYNKYADIDKIATIRIIGFADGTGFNKESDISKTLLLLLNDSLATKQQLNMKLSELRAKRIADLLDTTLSTRIDNYKNIQKLNFLFFETGKGEEFPSKKITDYVENDERRRVVILFWSVLPR